MIIGLSISDFITVYDKAHEILKRLATAPTRFSEFSNDIRNLMFILEEINANSEWKQDDSLGGKLADMMHDCERALHEAEKTIKKFTALSHAAVQKERGTFEKLERKWRRLMWDENEIQRHRSRILGILTQLHGFHNFLAIQKQHGEAALNWVTRTNCSLKHAQISTNREKDTGNWVFDCAEIKAWLESQGSTLLCHGIQGAGKSTLISLIIDHLLQIHGDKVGVGVAYLYCELTSNEEQPHVALIASLLKQLSQQRPYLPINVRQLYERHRRCNSHPSPEDLIRELDVVIQLFDEVIIVIDAIDECARKSAASLLRSLAALQVTRGIKLLVSSQNSEALAGILPHTKLEIRAQEVDICKYLQVHLPEFVSRDSDLQERIKTAITSAADGMFSLVKDYVTLFSHERKRQAMEHILNNLPKGSEVCKEAYDKVMARMERSSLQRLAKDTLILLISARRPLSIFEVQHALAIEQDATWLNLEYLDDIHKVVSASEGLISIDEVHGAISFSHRTVQEYLGQHKDFISAEEVIAKICVTYLSFSAFDSGRCLSDDAFETRLEQYPFYDYAACYWGDHVLSASIEDNHTVLNLLQSETKISAASQALLVSRRHNWYGYSQRIPSNIDTLHIIAYFGLHRAMDSLPIADLIRGMPKDSNGRTPLSWSAERGNLDVVSRIMKESLIEIDIPDQLGRTPLLWAAISGQEEVTKALVRSKNCKTGWKDKAGRTSFSWAAGNGHLSVVRFLLTIQDIDIDDPDLLGRTPLAWAAEQGTEDVIQMLLHTGRINVQSKDKVGRTPLSLAAENGHIGVLNLLLSCGNTDIESEDSNGRKVLSLAAQNGHKAVVERLLSIDEANINARSRDGRTAIALAAEYGHVDVVELLLGNAKVDANLSDMFDHSPLLWAAESGHHRVVELLIRSGKVNANAADSKGRTALAWAARKGHKAVVQYLLRVGLFDVNTKDAYYRTALSWAAENGHVSVIRILLTQLSIELDRKDASGRTPLSRAAENGHSATVQLLLETARVDVNSVDQSGCSPLAWAAQCGQSEIVDLLTRSDHIDFSLRDKKGRTALFWASSEGHEDIVRRLASKNIANVPDYWGQTPLSCAEENSWPDIARMLRSLQFQ